MANYKVIKGHFLIKQLLDKTVNNSEVLVDTDLISQTLKVGNSYLVEMFLHLTSASTPDWDSTVKKTGVVATYSGFSSNNDSTPFATALDAELIENTNGVEFLLIEALLIDVTTEGTVKFQFAQNVATASATTLHKGSFMRVTEI